MLWTHNLNLLTNPHGVAEEHTTGQEHNHPTANPGPSSAVDQNGCTFTLNPPPAQSGPPGVMLLLWA